jgi:hypothetical protein
MDDAFSKSDRRANGNGEQRENRGEVVPIEARPVGAFAESFSDKFTFDHPHWIGDRTSRGTYPESTRVAMGRQFARVLGDMLGKETGSREESIGTLKEALESPAQFTASDRHLYAAIEEVSRSRGYDQATKNLVQYMGTALEGLSLSQRLAVTGALMRETVVKMFSDMLDAPTDPRTLMSVSGDHSMRTVFGVRGHVETMSVTMVRGYLYAYFKEALREAQHQYEEKKAVLRQGGAIRKDDVFELTLAVDGESSVYKTTKDDLIKGYTSALIRYASVGYADRVRKRDVKAVE